MVRATALNRRKQTGDSVISAGSGGAGRKGESRRGERGSRPPAPRLTPAPASREGAGISLPPAPHPTPLGQRRQPPRRTRDRGKRPPGRPGPGGIAERRRAAPGPRRRGMGGREGERCGSAPRRPLAEPRRGGGPARPSPRPRPLRSSARAAGAELGARHVQATHPGSLRGGLKGWDGAAAGVEGFSLLFPVQFSLKEKRRSFGFGFSPPKGTAGSGGAGRGGGGAVLLAGGALWWGPSSTMI